MNPEPMSPKPMSPEPMSPEPMSPEPMSPEGVAASILTLSNGVELVINGGSELARQTGADLRDGVAHDIGYAATFDSRSVTDDPFDVMSHEDIWDKAGNLDASRIDGTSNNWRQLGDNASTAAAAFALEISRLVGTGWQGIAAEAAGQGVARYATSAVELMLSADGLAQKVQATSAGILATRGALPPPVPYGTGEKLLDIGSWLGRTLLPGDIKSIQHIHEETEEAARTVMKTQYAPAIRQAAVQVPVLPQALNPLSGSEGLTFTPPGSGIPYGGGDSNTGGYNGGGNTGGVGGGADGNDLSPQSFAQGASTQASSWAPTDAPATSPAGSVSGPNGTGPGGVPTPTNGASAASPPSGAVAPGLAGPGGRATGSNGSSRFGGGHARPGAGVSGGGAGGLGSGAVGAGRPGSGAIGAGGLGSGGLGAGGLAGGSAASGALAGSGAAPGRTGAPGMGGMGGMAPGAGRGAGSGEDDVHQTPSYLIDAVNGDELIGSLPLVAPPVLGE